MSHLNKSKTTNKSMVYQKKIHGFLLQNTYSSSYVFQNYVFKNHLFFRELSLLASPKSHHHERKILLISFQLIPQKNFISFMLSQILFQLLCKIIFYNLPPILLFYLRMLHLVICPHQGIIL
jgi:hypothetical protein